MPPGMHCAASWRHTLTFLHICGCETPTDVWGPIVLSWESSTGYELPMLVTSLQLPLKCDCQREGIPPLCLGVTGSTTSTCCRRVISPSSGDPVQCPGGVSQPFLWLSTSATWSATSVTRKPRPHRKGASGKWSSGLSSLIAAPSRCTKPADTMTAQAGERSQVHSELPAGGSPQMGFLWRFCVVASGRSKLQMHYGAGDAEKESAPPALSMLPST